MYIHTISQYDPEHFSKIAKITQFILVHTVTQYEANVSTAQPTNQLSFSTKLSNHSGSECCCISSYPSNIIERHISSTSQQPPAGTNLSFSAAKSPHVSRKGGHTDRRTSCGEPKEAAEIFQGIFLRNPWKLWDNNRSFKSIKKKLLAYLTDTPLPNQHLRVSQHFSGPRLPSHHQNQSRESGESTHFVKRTFIKIMPTV